MMSTASTQYSPTIEEPKTLVIFNISQGWMRIGTTFYCRGEQLVNSMVKFLHLSKQEFVEVPGRVGNYKKTVCEKETLAGLLLSLEQWVIKAELQRLQADPQWNRITPAGRMIRGREVIGQVGDRCRNRFELHALTVATLLSQTGDPEYLQGLLENGEKLIQFTGQRHQSPPSAREAGYIREASGVLRLASQDSVARMGSNETMPARTWRIIRSDQTLPDGYREVACKVDKSLRIEAGFELKICE